MMPNLFLPPGIPLLRDETLIKTTITYRRTLALLANSTAENRRELCSLLEQALHAIEAELARRSSPAPHA